jgi:hypothetical protein
MASSWIVVPQFPSGFVYSSILPIIQIGIQEFKQIDFAFGQFLPEFFYCIPFR